MGARSNAFIDQMVLAAFALMGALTKLAAQHDLSLTQLRVIGLLRDRQLTISELAAALGLDRSSIPGLVDRTVKRGLLQRQPNPNDARSVNVTLSADGIEAFELGASEILALLTPLTAAEPIRDPSPHHTPRTDTRSSRDRPPPTRASDEQ